MTSEHEAAGELPPHSASLRRRIVAVLLVVSLLPLGLAALGAWVVFGRLLVDRSLQLHRATVQSRAQGIDLYLQERLRALDLIAYERDLAELASPEVLRATLDKLNNSYGNAFTDLGVIDAAGRHQAYVGPYDLSRERYGDEAWFHEAKSQGRYVSDVFLGFRRVPHCVMVVRREESGSFWLLRATVNSDELGRLVRPAQRGRTGDAYLVNREGRFQTWPRTGGIMEESPLGRPTPHQGVSNTRVAAAHGTVLRSTAWVNRGRWALVVQQDEREVIAPLRQAMTTGGLLALLAVVLVVGTTLLATRHLTDHIDRATAERDTLSRDLLRSARLASLGELAAGLAHEINNPLAVVDMELSNIADGLKESPLDPALRQPLLEATDCCQRQVARCGRITGKMLQFGREGESRHRSVLLSERLEEMVGLMRSQAARSNVELHVDAAPDLPPVRLDPSELEQALFNLVQNAIHASQPGARIDVTARRGGHAESEVWLVVSDHGSGIAPHHLERVFHPFFTTKPAGQGTGLGLAVVYGLVRSWDGRVEVTSTRGVGTTFTIRLPALAGPREVAGPVSAAPAPSV